ncbi:helix-turn-helix domain-containing protein [Olegusella massiliensis]|uniref:helix-turn-helix domain-containing protein n=1 Tax=Olegusella massiliensis TaxID=1776381 RepID=UPI0040556FAF
MPTLAEMRKKRGISQATMAKELGISRLTYIQCEKDPQNKLTVNEYVHVCELIGIVPELLFSKPVVSKTKHYRIKRRKKTGEK